MWEKGNEKVSNEGLREETMYCYGVEACIYNVV